MFPGPQSPSAETRRKSEVVFDELRKSPDWLRSGSLSPASPSWSQLSGSSASPGHSPGKTVWGDLPGLEKGSPGASFKPVASFSPGGPDVDEDRIDLPKRVLRSPRDSPEQEEAIAEERARKRNERKAQEGALVRQERDESLRDRERQRRKKGREIRTRSKFDQDSMEQGEAPLPT